MMLHVISFNSFRCSSKSRIIIQLWQQSTKRSVGHNSSCNALEVWKQRVDDGEWRYDSGQGKAMKRLQRLQTVLNTYSNQSVRDYYHQQRLYQQQLKQKQDLKERQRKENEVNEEIKKDNCNTGSTSRTPQQMSNDSTTSSSSQPPKIPRGLYLYGSVGTGKTALMDLFYQTTITPNNNNNTKRRMHFYELIHWIHKELKYQKEIEETTLTKQQQGYDDTVVFLTQIQRVAQRMAETTNLLCIDEFQILDVADAMILSQFFHELLIYQGTVLVTTSNRHVHDLYQDGLYQFPKSITPCNQIIDTYCIVHNINTNIDFRRITMTSRTTNTSMIGSSDNESIKEEGYMNNFSMFFTGNNEVNYNLFDEMLLEWENTITDLNLPYGRKLSHVHLYESPNDLITTSNKKRIIKLDFIQLFVKNYLGAEDYRAIQHQKIDAIIINNFPNQLSDSAENRISGHNATRRFITFMDILYEARIPIAIQLASTTDKTVRTTTPDQLFVSVLYPNHDDQNSTHDNCGEISNNEIQDDMKDIDQAVNSHGHAVGAMANVKDLHFAFRRSASRLIEMTSYRWWEPILMCFLQIKFES